MCVEGPKGDLPDAMRLGVCGSDARKGPLGIHCPGPRWGVGRACRWGQAEGEGVRELAASSSGPPGVGSEKPPSAVVSQSPGVSGLGAPSTPLPSLWGRGEQLPLSHVKHRLDAKHDFIDFIPPRPWVVTS